MACAGRGGGDPSPGKTMQRCVVACCSPMAGTVSRGQPAAQCPTCASPSPPLSCRAALVAGMVVANLLTGPPLFKVSWLPRGSAAPQCSRAACHVLCVHIGTTRLQGLGTSGGGLWSWACHLAPTGQLRGPPDLQAAVVAAGESRSLPPPLTSELLWRCQQRRRRQLAWRRAERDSG